MTGAPHTVSERSQFQVFHFEIHAILKFEFMVDLDMKLI